MKLPSTLRPSNSTYRQCHPGKDLPSWFMDALKSIDEKLYIVYHPFQLIWDNMMNQYEGALDDPRFTIHQEHGEEVWGFVTTNGDGSPILEGAWHVWRLWEPHGWTHVVRIDSKAESYLRIMVNRLHTQAQFSDKYGALAWNQRLRDEQEGAEEKAQANKQERFADVQDQNKWLMKRAMDNMARGDTAPTNPTTGQIISYGGQKNRGTMERPLEDDDVGLIGMDDD